VGIYALLGDEAMRRTIAFETLLDEQGRMLKAMRARDHDVATSMLQHMREAAPQLAPLWEHYAEEIEGWGAAVVVAAQ
jgi:membrane-bound lytic murein transglycosylase MltF